MLLLPVSSCSSCIVVILLYRRTPPVSSSTKAAAGALVLLRDAGSSVGNGPTRRLGTRAGPYRWEGSMDRTRRPRAGLCRPREVWPKPSAVPGHQGKGRLVALQPKADMATDTASRSPRRELSAKSPPCVSNRAGPRASILPAKHILNTNTTLKLLMIRSMRIFSQKNSPQASSRTALPNFRNAATCATMASFWRHMDSGQHLNISVRNKDRPRGAEHR